MGQSIPTAGKVAIQQAEDAEAESDRRAPGEAVTGRRRTGRAKGITGLALLAIGAGMVAEQPALVLASVVGIAYAAAGEFGTAPVPELTIDRTVDESAPAPGDRVGVTLTVTNVGDRPLFDLRVVDGVPPGLSVVEGSPRAATALRPGEATSVGYEVEASRGSHAFDPVTVLTRDFAGATEYAETEPVASPIVCTPEFPGDPVHVPLRSQTTRFTGRTASDEGGTGVEFHATREYRPGDPLNRIDWNRIARTGDLTTVEYRRERAATALLVVDARASAYVAADPSADSAVDRSVDAAREVAASLLDAGHGVGVTAISSRQCWLGPGRGVDHAVALRDVLATSDAFARTPPDDDPNVYGAVRSIRGRIANDTQVVLFTPLVDDLAADAAHRFEAHGHLTTVVSPDPTADDTPGRETASLARSARVAATRHAGVPVVDWGPEEGFDRALARTKRRWSR